MFSVTKYYKVWFGFSGLLLLASAVLLIAWHLQFGIDFKGGFRAEVEFAKTVDASSVQTELAKNGFSQVLVQPVTDKKIVIRTEAIDDTQTAKFKQVLEHKFGSYQEDSLTRVGPTLGSELLRKAYWQIGLVVLGIVLYVSYAFRKIGRSMKKGRIPAWHLGVATIAALAHDLLIPIGVFVVLGHFKGVEVDSLFITALLTIMGFSVHDTIVVFDRIRENLQKYPYKSLQTIIDYSVSSTMARSINTSSTLIFVLIAMLLFGGQTVFYFILALLVGVFFGTYSSIFIASPILFLWHRET
jgi:preprotein translocase subunit SecF